MRKIYLLFLALILNIVYVSAANCGGNVTCHCGDTLTSSYNMTEDILNCNNALTIGANDTVLDCNGHIIDGTNTTRWFGVTISSGAKNSEIKNCIITEYYQGIRISTSGSYANAKIHSNIFINNSMGPYTEYPNPADIYISSNNNTIEANLIFGNHPNNPGIFLDVVSRYNLVRNNIISGKRTAIDTYEFTTSNIIESNTLVNNDWGVFQDGDYSIIKDNEISDGFAGIYFRYGTDNNLSNNFIHNVSNAIQITSYSYNNTFWNNTLTNNNLNVLNTAYYGNTNKFNLSNVGNYWDDYEENSGYPYQYNILNQGVDYHPIWDYSANIPIVYVHGYCSEPGQAPEMINSLKAQGYRVYELDYAPGDCSKPYNSTGCAVGDIKGYSRELKEFIDEVKTNTSAKRVNLVAHSMGGLISRWYIENPSIYGNDVGQLIEIATPNHGVEVKKVGYMKPLFFLGSKYVGCERKGDAVDEMSFDSSFLSRLNYNQGSWNWNSWQNSQEIINNNVDYKVIAGTNPPPLSWGDFNVSLETRLIKRVPKTFIHREGTDYTFTDYGDYLVPAYNVRLKNDNVGCDEFQYNHIDIMHKQDVISKVEDFLRNRPEQNDNCYYEDKSSSLRGIQEDLIDYGFSPIEHGSISQGESKTHIINVDSSIQNMTFSLFWERDDQTLNLKLIDPNGIEYNENYNSYYGTNISNQYYFDDPIEGNWTLNVTGTNIDGNENYQVGSGFLTPYLLGIDSYDYNYTVKPGETFKFIGYIFYNDSIYTDVDSFVTNIKTPSGNNVQLEMYDDGNHNDYNANDGIYGNSYSPSELGSYQATLIGIGNLGSEKIVRESDLTFWADVYPELSVNSSDISLNNNDPYVGQRITINAVIHNTGEGDAIGVPVMFYENNASGRLIGTSIVNVSMSGTNVASVEWGPIYAGNNKIYVVITPFGDFYENNYNNNYASKIINVKTRVGSSPLILKQKPKNTNPLLAPLIIPFIPTARTKTE